MSGGAESLRPGMVLLVLLKLVVVVGLVCALAWGISRFHADKGLACSSLFFNNPPQDWMIEGRATSPSG